MSSNKYNLILEQLVQAGSFGNLLVRIGYDPEGPKIVSVYGGNLDSNLRQNLDTVLNLVNFALLKKIKPGELASRIKARPAGYHNLPLDDLLDVVAQALQDAPESVNQINPGMLQELFVEAQRTEVQRAVPPAPSVPETAEEPAVAPEVSGQSHAGPGAGGPGVESRANTEPKESNPQGQGKFFNPFRDKRD